MNGMRCTCARAHFLYLRKGWADNVLIRYVVGDGSIDRFTQVIRGTLASQHTCNAHLLVHRQQGVLLVLIVHWEYCLMSPDPSKICGDAPIRRYMLNLFLSPEPMVAERRVTRRHGGPVCTFFFITHGLTPDDAFFFNADHDEGIKI